MVIQHKVAEFLDLRPPQTCVCGTCDLAWFKKGWQCPAARPKVWHARPFLGLR
jgi:hypothetical protein